MLLKQNYNMKEKDWDKNVMIYRESECEVKARLLYFHGGGLLYGSRDDLPDGHIALFTRAGYEILAFDYPLAPGADLEQILEDVIRSINTSCEENTEYTDSSLPYFLWGRSAGAYLCLIAAASGLLKKAPAGILSYYGYGFLCDNWYDKPAPYYCTLPKVEGDCLRHIPQNLHGDGDLASHYSVYVYARQTGNWKKLIYKGREKYFYLDYSLRLRDHLPCPLFAAHSTGDPDVPFAEFTELCNRYHPERFIASGKEHDFDRNPNHPFTAALLSSSLHFLEKQFKNEESSYDV